MWRIILRLFSKTPYIQGGLSFICFFSILSILLLRILYSHGLSQSFATSIPHITLRFLSEEYSDASRINQGISWIKKNWEVDAISTYKKKSTPIKLQAEDKAGDEFSMELTQVEIFGVDIREHPFVIPFDKGALLSKENFGTEYTIKELAWEMLKTHNVAIINEAMANLFRPASPVIAEKFFLSEGKDIVYRGDVRIMTILQDRLDIPRL